MDMTLWEDLVFGFSDQWVYLFRIILACLCGGAIGIERTLRQKDAGFRTHIIIALGATLFMIISKYGFFDIAAIAGTYPDANINIDVTRIASTIVTGISFVGAGMIFVNGGNVKGLTTAAGTWVTAAVGMAIGAGMYVIGLVGTVLVILVQIIFHTFLIGFDKVLANDIRKEISVRLRNRPEAVKELKTMLRDRGITVIHMNIATAEDTFVLVLTVKADKHADLDEIASVLSEEPDVLSIAV